MMNDLTFERVEELKQIREMTGWNVSLRHMDACERGLWTAGEVAKHLRKNFKFDCKAKELEEFADEWHHSGKFGNNMGKTYFFNITENYDFQKLIEKVQAKKNSKVTLVKFAWENDGSKNRPDYWIKVLKITEGSLADETSSFKRLISKNPPEEGKRYRPWEFFDVFVERKQK